MDGALVDPGGPALRTGAARPDVLAAFPGYPCWTPGWSTRLPAAPGVRQVCAYGIDTGGTSTLSMGCRTVTVR